jgi:hypothetical protein
VSGCPDRICKDGKNLLEIFEQNETDNGMKISLHEFFVKINFIEIATGLEYNVHVVKTCDLRRL